MWDVTSACTCGKAFVARSIHTLFIMRCPAACAVQVSLLFQQRVGQCKIAPCGCKMHRFDVWHCSPEIGLIVLREILGRSFKTTFCDRIAYVAMTALDAFC